MTAELRQQLDRAANLLADRLQAGGTQIVFAESCTAGLIAATLGRIPGISDYLCGAAVVYQIPTKTAWLGIPLALIEAHDAVSEDVAFAMASGALKTTPHADVAAAVTGHLGPAAEPPELDGVVWMACADRKGRNLSQRVNLDRGPGDDLNVRHRRQQEAALAVLQFTERFLAE